MMKLNYGRSASQQAIYPLIKVSETLSVPAAPFDYSPQYPHGRKGFMQKRKHYIKNWKTRYFVLEAKETKATGYDWIGLEICTPSGHHFVLHYYTDERCTTLKGTYIIGPDTVIETASDIDGREHVISVTSQKVSGKVEPLFVALDTQHEQSQWLFALEEVALRHRYAIDMPWYTTSQPSAFQCD
eukprot:gene4412-6033_t